MCVPFVFFFSRRCVSRNSIGESSTTLHLIVRPQLGVSVEPDLLVADFGSHAEFSCKIYAQDDDQRVVGAASQQLVPEAEEAQAEAGKYYYTMDH